MKQYFLIIISLVSVLNAKAQNDFTVEKQLFKINALTPGIVYEYGIDKKNTLYSEFRMGFGYQKDFLLGKGWSFFPSIEEEFRHYYNIESRGLKGKVISGNSGAYMGVIANYGFKSLTTNENFGYDNPSLLIGSVWGFQRTYKHNFNVNLNVGLGHFFIKNTSINGMTGILNLSLGWKIK